MSSHRWRMGCSAWQATRGGHGAIRAAFFFCLHRASGRKALASSKLLWAGILRFSFWAFRRADCSILSA